MAHAGHCALSCRALDCVLLAPQEQGQLAVHGCAAGGPLRAQSRIRRVTGMCMVAAHGQALDQVALSNILGAASDKV